jgi:hypothetical protein
LTKRAGDGSSRTTKSRLKFSLITDFREVYSVNGP